MLIFYGVIFYRENAMDKRKYIRIDIINILIIVIATIGLIFLITEDEYVFGSLVDWISQHSIFPEFFRQHFYDTGDLFMEFTMNLGAGQNGYNLSYHGMLNPIILVSILFPGVDMLTYTIVSSVVLIILSGILIYFWIKGNKARPSVALCAALLYVMAGPIVFHSHRQLVFVQYMPFLIMALMGVDNFFRKKKAKLLMVSIFLIYLTNYYFSIGAIAAITIYAVYKFLYHLDLKNERFTWKAFLKVGTNYALYVIIPTMMSMVLLWPTFLALINGRDENPTNNGFSLSYFLPKPEMGVIFYSAYSIGATAIFVFALIDFIRNRKKSRRFLGIAMAAIVLLPIVRYILNAGLYVRSKAIIPFLPLVIYIVAMFLNRLYRKKVEYKKLAIISLIVYVLIFIFNKDKDVFPAFTVDYFLMFLAILTYKKWSKIVIPLLSMLAVSVATFIVVDSEEIKVKDSYIDTLWDEDRKEVINATIESDSSFYRMNTLNDYRYNCNQYINKRYYQTSMYSSVYNKHFNEFVNDTLNLTNPTLNKISSINSNNILFETLMGIKYLDGHDFVEPIGYEDYKEYGNYRVVKNENVYSLGFATSDTMSYEVFNNLSANEKQVALLKYIVTEKGEDVLYTDYFTKLDVEIDFGSEFKENDKYHVELSEEKNIYVDMTDYNYDIYAVNIYLEKVEKEKVVIYVNSINNTLSGRSAAFVNNNLDFGYIVSAADGVDKLEIKMNKGNYVITGYDVYGLNYQEVLSLKSGIDMMTDVEIGDTTITGKINVNEDGYFNITIPYDEGFTLYIDDVKTEIELTDSAFMGCAITKGVHNIRLEYEAPGYNLGFIVSVVGFILFMGVLVRDIKCRKQVSG